MPPDSAALRRILSLMRAAREAGSGVPHGGGPPVIHDSAGAHARMLRTRVFSKCCLSLESGLGVRALLQRSMPAALNEASSQHIKDEHQLTAQALGVQACW